MSAYFQVEASQHSISEQFVEDLRQIAVMREAEDGAGQALTTYDISPEFGSGQVRLYHLMNGLTLTLFDAEFHQDILLDFILPASHFEIEYCVDGALGIQMDRLGEQLFRRNAMSVSMSCESRGRLRHIAGQRYQCVSLTADTEAISAYLGSAGAPLWQDTFEQLNMRKRSDYFIGTNASRELASCFLGIWHCSLPDRMRALYYESKVMEILSRLMAGEMTETTEEKDEPRLDEFEQEQIRKVPGLLADNLFELPTIAELSRRLAMNRNKLMSGFKTLYGDMIYGYHRRMCLAHAARMLSHTCTAIHEIALDAGYSSASNFCSAFKKEYGMTPVQYRQEATERPAG